MKYSICQNRDALRRLKKAHQYRTMLKRGDQRKPQTRKEATR